MRMMKKVWVLSDTWIIIDLISIVEDWNFDEFYEHASKKSKKTEKQPKSENQKSYKKITT